MKRKRVLKTRWILLIIVALLAVGLAGKSLFGRRTTETGNAYFPAEIRDLKITVSESGTVRPLKQLEIKCEVEGRDTTVLLLIPEGTFITEEDVNEEDPTKSRVLVELDSSGIRETITQQEITLQSAEASYTQALESYDIQVNQNESNIRAGELDVKFSRMDLDKYLGAELAAAFLEQPTAFADLTSDGQLDGEEHEPDLPAAPKEQPIAFTKLLDDLLDGEAMQELRRLNDSIYLADEEFKRATTKRDSTLDLHKRDFVADTELEADELALTRMGFEQKRTGTALDIFVKYDFPKQVEQKLVDYYEADKELQRIRARARSEQAQSEAERNRRKASLDLQEKRYTHLLEQRDACVIRATQPGLVVYATSGNRWNRNPPLEEGQVVRKDQVLINIPNTSQMAVQIKVHEAATNDVEKGQKATITFDAYPDLVLNGVVYEEAVLPDQQHRWLNPDLKVYSTDIVIEGENKLLKPGLSATVEILIHELHDVLVVPIQTVVPEGEGQVCYVLDNGRPRKQLVEIGRAGDEFIEIKAGLAVGDRVMLDPPRYGEADDGADEEEPDEEESERQEPEAAPDDTRPQEETDPDNAGEGRRRPEMTPEERRKAREAREKLTPEQRDKLRSDRAGRRGGAAGGRRPASTTNRQEAE